MIGRTSPPSPPLRLRDRFGDLQEVGNRAGALIRAVAVPLPLEPRASARILASLHGTAASARSPVRPPRLERLVLAGAVLVALGASGVGAAAALGWIDLGGPGTAAEITPLPPAPRPTVTPLPSGPVPEPSGTAPSARPGSAPPPAELALEPARLAIDPRAPGHRLALPGGFAARHAGQEFAWQLDVCVSPSGAVSSAKLVAPVHPQLDRRLLRAVAGWRYQPARIAGHAVRSCTQVVYRLAVEPAAIRTNP